LAERKQRQLIRGERHHWWPKVLSKHWAASNGSVHRLSHDGIVNACPPSSFAKIRDDNNILLDDKPTVWDSSFEHNFDSADGKVTPVIDWLKTVRSPTTPVDAPLLDRLTAFAISDERFSSMTVILASLIARSPGFRHRIDIRTNAMRGRFGLPAIWNDSILQGMNVRHAQATLSRAMTRGKIVVLLGGTREFTFGDGFLHNVSSISHSPHTPRCLVPLTPEVAIFYTSPTSYRPYPRAFAINLSSEETAAVNRSVQIYSNRYIFYRFQRPDTEQEFLRGEHLQYQNDTWNWLDNLEDAACGQSPWVSRI